jgi:hypothetical protein
MAQYNNVVVVYFERHRVKVAGSKFTAIRNFVFGCLGLGHREDPFKIVDYCSTFWTRLQNCNRPRRAARPQIKN